MAPYMCFGFLLAVWFWKRKRVVLVYVCVYAVHTNHFAPLWQLRLRRPHMFSSLNERGLKEGHAECAVFESFGNQKHLRVQR